MAVGLECGCVFRLNYNSQGYSQLKNCHSANCVSSAFLFPQLKRKTNYNNFLIIPRDHRTLSK